MDVEWKEGAVCFAGGFQFKDWDYTRKELQTCCGNYIEDVGHCLKSKDFQINTIKQGDCIEASELDTEQKYNDAVEVFDLFGFKLERHVDYKEAISHDLIFAHDSGVVCFCTDGHPLAKRKLTYPQLMAIGELKRLEIKRNRSMGGAVSLESMFAAKPTEWTDKHYDFNYQLTQEDIEKGHVRVDAYFVNRMWKVNQWDDTGAAFHVLKTLPRISNNKNPLKRELVALKKQVDLLCKMHGVDDGDLKGNGG